MTVVIDKDLRHRYGESIPVAEKAYDQVMAAIEHLGYRNVWYSERPPRTENSRLLKNCYVAWNGCLWPGLEITIEPDTKPKGWSVQHILSDYTVNFTWGKPGCADCPTPVEDVSITVDWGYYASNTDGYKDFIDKFAKTFGDITGSKVHIRTEWRFGRD